MYTLYEILQIVGQHAMLRRNSNKHEYISYYFSLSLLKGCTFVLVFSIEISERETELKPNLSVNELGSVFGLVFNCK